MLDDLLLGLDYKKLALELSKLVTITAEGNGIQILVLLTTN